jgi:trans-2,3-dihydro-3-hydroxyanthranilate isomerase
MRKLKYFVADVFTDKQFGGNPLAVVLEATGLDTAQMQRIAIEFNLSETTFILPPEKAGATHKVRIFTPGAELPFAGHPTVGTAVVMADAGLISGDTNRVVFEEGVGLVPVKIERGRGKATSAQFSTPRTPERVSEPPPRPLLAQLLGLPEAALAAPEIRAGGFSAGVPLTIIPMRDAAALAAVQVDVAAFRANRTALGPAPALYPIYMEDWRRGRAIRVRMFAPLFGIGEDPATGGAAAALPAFLAENQNLSQGTTRWMISQGSEMGRPSTIGLEADSEAGRIKAVRVDGSALIVSEGTFYLQD